MVNRVSIEALFFYIKDNNNKKINGPDRVQYRFTTSLFILFEPVNK